MQAAELNAHYLSIRASDSFGREKQLRDQAASIIAALGLFRNLIPETLTDARSIIDRFLGEVKPLYPEPVAFIAPLQRRPNTNGRKARLFPAVMLAKAGIHKPQ